MTLKGRQSWPLRRSAGLDRSTLRQRDHLMTKLTARSPKKNKNAQSTKKNEGTQPRTHIHTQTPLLTHKINILTFWLLLYYIMPFTLRISRHPHALRNSIPYATAEKTAAKEKSAPTIANLYIHKMPPTSNLGHCSPLRPHA